MSTTTLHTIYSYSSCQALGFSDTLDGALALTKRRDHDLMIVVEVPAGSDGLPLHFDDYGAAMGWARRHDTIRFRGAATLPPAGLK